MDGVLIAQQAKILFVVGLACGIIIAVFAFRYGRMEGKSAGYALGSAVTDYRFQRLRMERVPFQDWQVMYLSTKLLDGLPHGPFLARQVAKDFAVITPNGIRAGRAGDWIAAPFNQHDQDMGIRHWISDHDMQKHYRRETTL